MRVNVAGAQGLKVSKFLHRKSKSQLSRSAFCVVMENRTVAHPHSTPLINRWITSHPMLGNRVLRTPYFKANLMEGKGKQTRRKKTPVATCRLESSVSSESRSRHLRPLVSGGAVDIATLSRFRLTACLAYVPCFHSSSSSSSSATASHSTNTVSEQIVCKMLPEHLAAWNLSY